MIYHFVYSHIVCYSWYRCPNMAVENSESVADAEEEEDEMDKKAQKVTSETNKKRKIK